MTIELAYWLWSVRSNSLWQYLCKSPPYNPSCATTRPGPGARLILPRSYRLDQSGKSIKLLETTRVDGFLHRVLHVHNASPFQPVLIVSWLGVDDRKKPHTFRKAQIVVQLLASSRSRSSGSHLGLFRWRCTGR